MRANTIIGSSLALALLVGSLWACSSSGAEPSLPTEQSGAPPTETSLPVQDTATPLAAAPTQEQPTAAPTEPVPTEAPTQPPAEEATSAPDTAQAEALAAERCTGCHTLDRVRAAAKSADEWEQTVTRMIDHGARLSEDEKALLIEYLATSFGP